MRSFESVPPPTPYDLIPKIGGLQPAPKTPIVVILGKGEAMDFKIGRNIHRVHPNKSSLKNKNLGEKGVKIFFVLATYFNGSKIYKHG